MEEPQPGCRSPRLSLRDPAAQASLAARREPGTPMPSGPGRRRDAQRGPRAWRQETLGSEWKEVGGPAPATSPDITAQIRSFQAAVGRLTAAPAAGARPAPTPSRVGRQRAPGAPPGGAEPGGAERAGAAEQRGGRARSPAQPSAAQPGAAQPSPEPRASQSQSQVSKDRPAAAWQPRRWAAPCSQRVAKRLAGGGLLAKGWACRVQLPRLLVRAGKAPHQLEIAWCTGSALAFQGHYFCHHPRMTQTFPRSHTSLEHTGSGHRQPFRC